MKIGPFHSFYHYLTTFKFGPFPNCCATISLKSVSIFLLGSHKKNWEKAVRLTASICENVDPFLSFIKRQNNPKYGNFSNSFHIYLTASGVGSTKAVSMTAFSQFFLMTSLTVLTVLHLSKTELYTKHMFYPICIHTDIRDLYIYH